MLFRYLEVQRGLPWRDELASGSLGVLGDPGALAMGVRLEEEGDIRPYKVSEMARLRPERR